MSDELKRDFLALGLEEAASLLEIERAYRKVRSRYDVESLTTYPLFDDDQCLAILRSLEESYRRILRDLEEREAAARNQQQEEPPEEAVDPEENPGSYLRQLRERAHLSLWDVAESTKVGIFQLRSIEQQRFDKLPAPVYLRGFVSEFARCVGAPDPKRVAFLFLEHFRRAGFA